MPERICSKALEYPPGKKHAPGDVFDVHEDHLRVLTDAGFIERERPADTPEIPGTLHLPQKPKPSGKAARK